MPLSAWAFALASAIIFGLALNLAQRGIRHIDAALGSVISIPTACIMFWLSSPWTASFAGWRWDAALLFFCTGLFYPAAVTILTFDATRWLGPNITASLGNMSPLWAVAVGVLVLGEVLGLRQVAGILAMLVGVTFLTASRGFGGGASWPMWALALPVAASMLRGIGQPLLKVGFGMWNNPRVATLLCYVASASVVITVGLLRTRGTAARFTPLGVKWFMLVGVLNGIATWAGIEAVARGPVALVAPVVATYPLFTLVIGLAMARSLQLNWKQAAGVAATVTGVVLLLIG